VYGVVLHAHPVRGESHNQRNTTVEVATLGSRTEHGSFIRASPPVLTEKAWYRFETNKTINIFLSQNKFIEACNGKHLEYSVGSPTFLERKMPWPSKRCQHFQCPCISSWNL